jgi:2-polyprenyl-3-methyl-5-hydroxy-6-metoxy-1,4-benzoquinol methylase
VRGLDRLLQRWRIARAVPWVREGDRLLDVGCFDRTLLDRVSARIASGVGVDPLAEPVETGAVRILRGHFPEDFDLPDAAFDCITMLAVFEHAEDPDALAAECHRLLSPGGRAVLTVPHPAVDPILDVLMFVGLADGMSTEEHHGFDVGQTVPIFERAGFRLHAARSFQLGLNRLFVFERG